MQQVEAAIAHQSEEGQRERQAHLNRQAQATIKALRDTLPGWNEQTLPELEKYVDGYGLSLDSAADGYLHKCSGRRVVVTRPRRSSWAIGRTGLWSCPRREEGEG